MTKQKVPPAVTPTQTEALQKPDVTVEDMIALGLPVASPIVRNGYDEYIAHQDGSWGFYDEGGIFYNQYRSRADASAALRLYIADLEGLASFTWPPEYKEVG